MVRAILYTCALRDVAFLAIVIDKKLLMNKEIMEWFNQWI